jgi:Fe-S oxidoreductase
MWAEDSIGERINSTRMAEATATGATTVVTACPFCAIMLDDAAAASAEKPVVSDVSLMVLAAVRRADQREPPLDGKA